MIEAGYSLRGTYAMKKNRSKQEKTDRRKGKNRSEQQKTDRSNEKQIEATKNRSKQQK